MHKHGDLERETISDQVDMLHRGNLRCIEFNEEESVSRSDCFVEVGVVEFYDT